MRAADIANLLLGSGIPLLGYGAHGGKLSMTFMLDGKTSYVALLPEAEATPERFRELYRTVA
jgi:hypothetical protein